MSVRGVEDACHHLEDILPDVLDALTRDSGRLHQVLGNLIGNAVKLTRQGEVVVTAVGRWRCLVPVTTRFVSAGPVTSL